MPCQLSTAPPIAKNKHEDIETIMISLKNINKIYTVDAQPFYALKDIHLRIKRGEICGVLGKSGAGKSTLLRCVNLLERPTAGQVIVNGIDLMTLTPGQLRYERHKIGVIFQHYNLLESRTVYQNVALPLEIIGQSEAQIHAKVSSLLELVGLTDRQHYYASQLSGGQKQRVGIARALAADPHVLLCDEATSALDADATASILHLLKKINRELGLTILLITHELDVVKQVCDRVSVIHEGMLVEEDTTLNIFANPKHRVTKQLVQQALHFYTPTQADENVRIIKLTFIGEDSEDPLISTLVKRFDVTVNIKQAQIEKIQDTTVGFTICQIAGELSAIDQALTYIRSTSVQAEVLHG